MYTQHRVNVNGFGRKVGLDPGAFSRRIPPSRMMLVASGFPEVDCVAALNQDAGMNVRRLAAVDMHGAAGRALRRRIILAEFVLGFVGMVAIGSSAPGSSGLV
jgi:hypothetical protein